ncbi:hypothetical protein AGOR_G00147430 [Albula goreensis]|uniref:Uncharacterized protein n=1 Tax=Albula goreensis TaxID=1534307 RepID=A0A8T3DB04_9TELE|nr:hypothetical protein AGOR_G00147430 [Albula goreensis]
MGRNSVLIQNKNGHSDWLRPSTEEGVKILKSNNLPKMGAATLHFSNYCVLTSGVRSFFSETEIFLPTACFDFVHTHTHTVCSEAQSKLQSTKLSRSCAIGFIFDNTVIETVIISRWIRDLQNGDPQYES